MKGNCQNGRFRPPPAKMAAAANLMPKKFGMIIAYAKCVPNYKKYSTIFSQFFFLQLPILSVESRYKKERKVERKMVHEFSIDDFKNMHLGLITRERVIREQWIPIERDPVKRESLVAEADALDALQKRVCAAQLSLELGFYVPAAV